MKKLQEPVYADQEKAPEPEEEPPKVEEVKEDASPKRQKTKKAKSPPRKPPKGLNPEQYKAWVLAQQNPQEEEEEQEQITPELYPMTAEEQETFRRFWMWERYFSENKKEYWFESGELMRTVNKYVIQDMSDNILMKVFDLSTKDKMKKVFDQVQEMKIEKDTFSKWSEMSHMKKKQERDELCEKLNGQFEEEYKKRDFCVQMRPPFIWNFFGEEAEEIEHLINPGADPKVCYKFDKENRVVRLLDACTDLGTNLKTNMAADWDKLVAHTIKIFQQHHEDHMSQTQTFQQKFE